MSSRRPITEFKGRYLGQEDIWIIGAAASLDFVQPNFFKNKIVIGVNNVYKKFPCTYLVRKEKEGADEARASGISLILSEYDSGDHNAGKNEVDGEAWYFDHEHNACSPVDLSVVGTDKIVVSWSTITSAIHVAAYMGAANIIICGHDGGTLDGENTYKDYYPDNSGYKDWYRGWVGNIMGHSRQVRDKLQEVYGCLIYTLNPFIGFDLEGHEFISSEKK